jgi:hypothetical protein
MPALTLGRPKTLLWSAAQPAPPAPSERGTYPTFEPERRVHRGVEVDLGLRPGLLNEGFVAEAIGNLAAFELARARGEPLDWQVLRVETSAGHHHFRLIVRHPERLLDVGFARELGGVLRSLSDEDVDALRQRFEAARRGGLKPVPLRHVRESVDLWRDDFWNWLG